AGERETGHVALDVGHEHWHTHAREALGQDHQRDGLAGAGGARDEPMPVRVLADQVNRPRAFADEDIGHGIECTPTRMTEYKPQQLEKKWQQHWTSTRAFEVVEDPARPKYYC